MMMSVLGVFQDGEKNELPGQQIQWIPEAKCQDAGSDDSQEFWPKF